MLKGGKEEFVDSSIIMAQIAGRLGAMFMEKAKTRGKCACDATMWSFLATRFTCWARMWPKACGEAKVYLTKIRDGSLTMREAGWLGQTAAYSAVFFFAGEVVGRGSLVGYQTNN